MPKSQMRTVYLPQGYKVYSYQTVIRQSLADGTTIGNLTYYSRTTGRHQMECGADKSSVILTNVPEGCPDLLAEAISQGKIIRYHWQSDMMPAPAYCYVTPDKMPVDMPRLTIF